MRDTVIIGAGLSGLAAAVELEKRAMPYTLIEVKRQPGGGIDSVRQGDYIFDSGPMVHALADVDWFHTYMLELGLDNELVSLPDGRIAFKHGTRTLVDAMIQQINAPVMRRMAVSTLGRSDDGRFSICMENGMVLDAGALIVAAPARYAERMLYTLVPEAAYRLLDYRYDHIARVSFGYEHVHGLDMPDDYPVTYIDRLVCPNRAPADAVILQVGLRFDPAHGLPQDPVGEIAALMGWPDNPAADHIAIWPESDPIMFLDDDFAGTLQTVQAMLPDGVALIGSDYFAHQPRLDERIRAGITAAAQI
jgi:protoporphyrinogen oxidase